MIVQILLWWIKYLLYYSDSFLSIAKILSLLTLLSIFDHSESFKSVLYRKLLVFIIIFLLILLELSLNSFLKPTIFSNIVLFALLFVTDPLFSCLTISSSSLSIGSSDLTIFVYLSLMWQTVLLDSRFEVGLYSEIKIVLQQIIDK